MNHHRFRLASFSYSLVVALVSIAAAASVPSLPRFDAAKLSEIPKRMQEFVDQGEISGAVTLVADRDRIVHLAAIGKSDLSTGRKMRTDDLFWIASMTKPMTAVCVAMLADEGKLGFDDPVEKYLPEFRNQWVVTEQGADHRALGHLARPVTLRDLLTHTSGLGEYVVTDPHWTLGQMSLAIAREPLRFQPGSRWAYSTAGIDTLGRVVEVVSGIPFAEFMQERLFRPLGMKDSTFWVPTSQESRFARNYRRNSGTGNLEPAVITYMYGGAITDRKRPPLGGAGLFSTAYDVARFYQMMLNGGSWRGRRILKPETVAEMTRKQTGDLKAGFIPGSAWGLGFVIVTEPQDVTAMLPPGTFGHGGAHGTQSWADPRRGVIYVMMIQRAGLRNSDNSDMRCVFQETAAGAIRE